jgi:hypothetical protein
LRLTARGEKGVSAGWRRGEVIEEEKILRGWRKWKEKGLLVSGKKIYGFVLREKDV